MVVNNPDASSGFWLASDLPLAVVGALGSTAARNRPALAASDHPAFPNAGVFPVEERGGRVRLSSRGSSNPRSLNPTEVISTRARRRTAAAAGVARPAVDWLLGAL